MPFVSDLDKPLLHVSPHDPFTLRDACNGVHVFGAIGSGKTSGFGYTLRVAYLRAGMGGLVCAAKPEEVRDWIAAAEKHGRGKSLVVFDERHGFNFLEWVLARFGTGGIANAVEFLMRILEAADHAAGVSGGSRDEFWPQAVRQFLNRALPAIYAAHGRLLAPLEAVCAFPLAFIVYRIQRHWYGDDGPSAAIKAMIVGLLTAIPVATTPYIVAYAVGGGLLGLRKNFRRKEPETFDHEAAPRSDASGK